MARGGKRPGAGRKPGSATQRTREIADGAASTGELPLEYMLRVMRDHEAPVERRDEMAKAAAKFCHPALQAVEWKPRGDEAPKGADDPAARAPASGDDLNQIVARFNAARAVKPLNGATQH